MSNQQIGTVVGAAIGFFVPVVGVALGASIGGAVGALLTEGEKTEGPRLDDLKVSFSTYGVGIPLLYGTERLGGNCVWSTDKLEISNTEGGKGGAPEHTTYKYYVHQRYVLCETPRDGSTVHIVRILVDGKLQWDARSGIPLGSALASAENVFVHGTLWQGDENQLPDGNEEPWEGGPGSVAAYRGVVSYSVIALECPNGRIPQLSFVVSTTSTIGPEVLDYTTITTSLTSQRTVINKDGVWQFDVTDASVSSEVWLGLPGTSELVTSIPGMIVGYSRGPLVPIKGGEDPEAARDVTTASSVSGYAEPVWLQVFNMKTGESRILWEYTPETSPNQLRPKRCAKDKITGAYAFTAINGIYEEAPIVIDGAVQYLFDVITGLIDIAFYDGVVYVLRNNGGSTTLRLYTPSGAFLQETTSPRLADGLRSRVRADEDGVFVMLHDGDVTFDTYFYKVDFAWHQLAVTGDIPNVDAQFDTFYCNDSYALVGPTNDATNTIRTYETVLFHTVELGTKRVSDIITDLCERAGETRFDVSEIPDTDVVHGYKIGSVASVRANVEPLMKAFGIYVVDEDGLIKFRKREDLVSVASVSYDELGQAEDGAEPGDPMPLNHTQEIDLPRSATVSYIEPEFDYQVASEPYYREITDSIEDIIIDLPVALTSSNQAKQVAQWAVYERALAQNTRTCKLSRKYAFVSPGDGLTIEYPRGTWRLWFVASTTDTGALCEFNLQPGDAQLLTQTAIGATGYPSQQVSALAPPTRMLLLDSPIMRDEDNNAGLYVAAEGYGAGWRGYTLWVGDDDLSLQERGSIIGAENAVPIGFAETALGAWTPNMFDGQNSVIVNMGDDSLSSTTNDLLMTTRVNLALIGVNGRWEAIQFQTASSLGDGRYLLYGFLRGQFGTERFAGLHAVSDQFVLIYPAGMLRPNQDVGSLGQEKKYRPVSLGRSKDSTTSTSFANTGVGLLPYSPWDARKSKAASNDQTITWQRRSRLSTNALRGVVPLGEATESYSIELYTSSAFTTLAGTLTSTTKSLTITSAQQTAFGLTPGATLYVHIRQVSDVVGAGPALEATL